MTEAEQGHHEEHIHLPSPSGWPIFVALGCGLLPPGLIMFAYGHSAGVGVFAAGLMITVISALGWATNVIRTKDEVDSEWGNRTLSMAWKLFLLSEASVFAAFFAHYGYTLYVWDWANVAWPPSGTPHIHLIIPAFGTLILITSSLTCEMGHKAMMANRRELCKTWLFITLCLGFVFLALQGYEWGYLQQRDGFFVDTNVAGTIFYLITGFHGAHVITGLVLLLMVYARLEMGSFDRKRHFSMQAASWYWHFVDVIWIFVFLFLYVGLQHR